MSCEETFRAHVNALAAYLPNGRMFEAKGINESNLRQLLNGLTHEMVRSQGYICTFGEDYFPDATTLYIEEWERAVQIPDDCFPGTGTIDERRRDILVKLASLGVQTADDFVNLGAVFGITITVTSLSIEAFPPYDVPFFPSDLTESRFTIVVEGTAIDDILKCLIRKQIQANGAVIFREIP